MFKRSVLIFLFSVILSGLSLAESYDIDAYVYYQKGNEFYRNKDYEDAKELYLKCVSKYPDSSYTPYCLYILSFIEKDYIKVIDYLTTVKNKFPDFENWVYAVEKLGDVYYIIGNTDMAVRHYQMAKTDRSYYMIAFLRSSEKKSGLVIESVHQLLQQTTDKHLVYKGLIILAQTYLDQKRYGAVYPVLFEAVQWLPWSNDQGARILFLAGQYYYYHTAVVDHYQKSLYVFSLLKTRFPLSIEASMSQPFLDKIREKGYRHKIQVSWLVQAFEDVAVVPFQENQKSVSDRLEEEAEMKSREDEMEAGSMIESGVEEYIVRLGSYKDLSIANLIAVDIATNLGEFEIPVGVFYREDSYFVEIRGIETKDEAEKFASVLVQAGYEATRVIEKVSVVHY